MICGPTAVRSTERRIDIEVVDDAGIAAGSRAVEAVGRRVGVDPTAHDRQPQHLSARARERRDRSSTTARYAPSPCACCPLGVPEPDHHDRQIDVVRRAAVAPTPAHVARPRQPHARVRGLDDAPPGAASPAESAGAALNMPESPTIIAVLRGSASPRRAHAVVPFGCRVVGDGRAVPRSHRGRRVRRPASEPGRCA